MLKKIVNVGVIGAGTMGLGIAQVIAMAGYKVQLFDARSGATEEALKQIKNNLQKGVDKGKVSEGAMQSTLHNIALANKLHELTSDLVIEAIIEKLTVKQEVFLELEKVLASDAIFCSNTSSLSVTKIAAGMQNGQRLVGVHFFNPAHIMKLVEVIAATDTDSQVLATVVDFVKRLNKVPVLARDAPGFIVNRVARHFYVESLRVLEENVASVEDIDKLMEATGFKMGPFRLMDLIGIDTNFAVTASLYNGFHQDPKFRPSRIQEQMVLAGHLGKKSRKGFYIYE